MSDVDPDILHQESGHNHQQYTDNLEKQDRTNESYGSFDRNQFRRSTIGTQWQPQAIDGEIITIHCVNWKFYVMYIFCSWC